MPDEPAPSSQGWEVIVLGAGAAGLMCAATAGARGRSVLVLDRANKVGKKILMSGGGRCNFTNIHTTPDNFISANPHFCKSALARYTPWDFIALVEKHGIAYHEKELGQLFCDESSKQIVRMLLDECEAVGAQVRTRVETTAVERLDEGFELQTHIGPLRCAALVVATGGLSIPKMGGSGFGYELARRFGHAVHETRAALVPLTFSGAERSRWAELSGVSVEAVVEAGGHRWRNGLLFTHRGISGPTVLQASSYWREGEDYITDLLPDTDGPAWLAERRAARPDALLSTVLAERLPKRLAQHLCATAFQDQPIKRFDEPALASVGQSLNRFRFSPSGTEGYATAEVTLGGVATDEISSRSFESQRVPGLYFIGEVLDVTGHLGGFNFQWAWASGRACGEVV